MGKENTTVCNSEFLTEARKILDAAEQRGIVLRLLGSIAFRIHCPTFSYLFEKFERPLTDLDFITRKTCAPSLPEFFAKLDYEFDKSLALITRGKRYKFKHKKKEIVVDIFFDKLDMCHVIDLTKRLEVDSPTLSVSDLLLEKLQIVEITKKDIQDVIVLLLEHDVGNEDREMVNSEYIAQLCSKDWGLWKTATTNLMKLRQFLSYVDIESKHKATVTSRIEKILQTINAKPKYISWRLRSLIGERKRWYKVVEAL